jgi:hypothetical protein
LIRLDEGQKLVSVVSFEEEEHEGGSGSSNGEGHISGAVKLKTEQSISDILQFAPTQDEMAAIEAQDEFESFAEHTQAEVDDIVAKEEMQLEDKGSILDEF